ncbi:hypothetical protein BVC80_1211g13 [Macleaya cordata]|uniref:Uncharacterized protein n=1 Tax=Macleaya cordata TaxID=56857 RepID=A0A200Q398_MACCD|nr:hypothetical protein BVC80_1211g13 [Macleaya cordata]
MPSAPWMKGPLLIPSDQLLDLSRIRKQKKNFNKEESNDNNNNNIKNDWSLTDGIRGGRGKQAMRLCIRRSSSVREFKTVMLELQQIPTEFATTQASNGQTNSVGISVALALPNSKLDVRMPWVRTEKIVYQRSKKEKVVTAEELSLPELVLTRLGSDSVKLSKLVKVNKAGVTQASNCG